MKSELVLLETFLHTKLYIKHEIGYLSKARRTSRPLSLGSSLLKMALHRRRWFLVYGSGWDTFTGSPILVSPPSKSRDATVLPFPWPSKRPHPSRVVSKKNLDSVWPSYGRVLSSP